MAVKASKELMGSYSCTRVLRFSFPTYGLNWTDEALKELVNNNVASLRTRSNCAMEILTRRP